MKKDSYESIGCLVVVFFVILLIGGWKGVKEWGGNVLFFVGIIIMMVYGIPFLKRYVFDNDVSLKDDLSRKTHSYLLRPIAFILLVISVIIGGIFLIHFIFLRTSALIGE